jgi:hypothetical protein
VVHSPVNAKLVAIALAEIDTTGFEKFGQSFYGALAGKAFVPLGGMHDGGAEGFFEPELFEDAAVRHFLQISKQQTYAVKIRGTLARLREFGRQPDSLTYLTSETIPNIDMVEEAFSDELQCRIRIRDAKYIESQINSSEATIVSFETYLQPALAHLLNPGSAPIALGPTLHANRTLAVFLRQEVEHRLGKTHLLESVADSLIIWSLSETDPESGRFMKRAEILARIETALPSARTFIRGVLDDRLAFLGSKGADQRQIRRYAREGKYCLPRDTRELVKQENIEDSALKLAVTSIFERRCRAIAGEGEDPLTPQVVQTCHAVLERIFEHQGLEVARFASDGDEDDELYTNAADLIAEVVDEAKGNDHSATVRRLTTGVLRGVFYDATPDERAYLLKLSQTYVLLLLLQNEPKIVEYFNSLSSRFNLYVGTDFLVRALSEHYLSEENQMTKNLFSILISAGANLILTEKAVDELSTHIRSQILEFENHYMHAENGITLEAVEYIDRILIRSYFYARLAPLSSTKPPAGWRSYIEQFGSYASIRADRGNDDLGRYLVSKFGLNYESAADMKAGIEENQIEALAAEIVRVKSESGRPKGSAGVLAYNDALHVLRVYQRRKMEGEHSPVNPFGFRTWWLTQDSKVRRAAAGLIAQHHGQRFMMRPDFLLNFVSLAPSAQEVKDSYRAIFPSVLGIKLSNRVSSELFKKVMANANEVWAS